MLELKNVSYTIDNENILNDISLCFKKGEITVITGQNGSGKSTMVKLIMGLEKVSSGQILFGGEDITNTSLDERARKGFTIAFQTPVRFKGLKVKDMIDIASGEEISLSDACEYLSKVGLCARNYIDREVDGSLSGGELKRIELALSIAKGGEVYLFDEPEAGIDLWSFDNLINVFKQVKDKTIIIISHQKKILEIADSIVLLNKNSQPIYGSRQEVLPLVESNKCRILEAANGQDW